MYYVILLIFKILFKWYLLYIFCVIFFLLLNLLFEAYPDWYVSLIHLQFLCSSLLFIHLYVLCNTLLYDYTIIHSSYEGYLAGFLFCFAIVI